MRWQSVWGLHRSWKNRLSRAISKRRKQKIAECQIRTVQGMFLRLQIELFQRVPNLLCRAVGRAGVITWRITLSARRPDVLSRWPLASLPAWRSIGRRSLRVHVPGRPPAAHWNRPETLCSTLPANGVNVNWAGVFPPDSTEQSPSWETIISSASEEINHILWNPKVDYRIHENLSFIRILSRMNLLLPPPRFLKIHFNIILPHTPRYSKWSPSLRFPHQNPICTYPLPHTYYMPRSSHSSRFWSPKKYFVVFSSLLFLEHHQRIYSICSCKQFIPNRTVGVASCTPGSLVERRATGWATTASGLREAVAPTQPSN